MKAMIFAAGLGTRLRPLTDRMPKALVPVGGVPALQRVIESVAAAGINDVVINVHHFSQMIRDFLAAHHNFGIDIRVSDESDQLLDTGGGLLKALPLTGDEPVLLHNADIATDLDLGEMVRAFDRDCCDALLLTADRQSSRKLLFDDSGMMRGWKNIGTGETRPDGIDDSCLHPLAFGGIHIMSPSLFPALERYGRSHGPVFSITPFYISACGGAAIRSYTPAERYRWFDIGRPASLAEAGETFRK